jgi:hypothetical protein
VTTIVAGNPERRQMARNQRSGKATSWKKSRAPGLAADGGPAAVAAFTAFTAAGGLFGEPHAGAAVRGDIRTAP